MTRTVRIMATGAALTMALVVGACSSSSTTSGQGVGAAGTTATSAGSAGGSGMAAHNQADAMFAAGMIPHHEQAIEMADLALKTSTNADIKALAAQIKQAQAPEIEKMNGWLSGWGATSMPSGDMGDMGGMGATGSGTEGMGGMSDAEMSALEQATGVAFDRMFLQSMTKHHQGAIAMANAELSQGQYPEAKTLAQSIVDSQTKEIATMQQLLQKVGS